MDQWKVIGYAMVAVLASGCVDSGSSQQGIAVNELSVEPNSIRAGESVSVSLEAVNAGLLEGTVDVGDATKGEQVLTNHCPDYFSIEEFRASSSRTSESVSEYDLGEGERIRLFWRLKQDSEDVPLQGYNCPMRFELPFDYSVRAYKQLQVKQDRETEGSTNLATDISPGPLAIDMEIIGSTADQPNTILEENDASLYLTAYNQDTEDSVYQGLIDINDIEIQGGGAISVDDECGERESVTLISGNQEIYRCNIEHEPLNSPSVRGEITANIDYTFVKSIGERQVKVKYGGQ
jgi:hypothetical protein